MTPLVAAAVQLTSTDDVAQNLARCDALVTDARASGAEFVGLPENFAFLGSDRDHRAAIAESTADDATGPILTAMRDLARRTSVWLLLGGFPEKGLRPGSIRNTSVLLDPRGSIVARYRKVHLFDVDVPGGMQFRESESVDAGDDVVLAETPWGGLGLTICYDLRFPELFRRLGEQQARMIAVPSAFTRETGKDHWHLLLRARAVENQVFVIAPAQFGWHGGKRFSYGHALIADPWGAVIAECGDHEGFALARLDFAYQDRVRSSLPCLRHRKL
ncbi:MAG: deaminated glutathione amidase [Myxococcales bacterium]|jgi:predicted amidohydrolase|nr:deaminated glutathione amidase [Myxococcales bacterium]